MGKERNIDQQYAKYFGNKSKEKEHNMQLRDRVPNNNRISKSPRYTTKRRPPATKTKIKGHEETESEESSLLVSDQDQDPENQAVLFDNSRLGPDVQDSSLQA